MVVLDAIASPCRPRSARYAEKGYPNYAELDARRRPRWRSDGGGRAKKPKVRSGRKRRRGEDVEAAAVGKVQPSILQAEEAVTQEHGRKRRMTDATAADKVFPLIEDGIVDGEEEAASTDERGVGDYWRQRMPLAKQHHKRGSNGSTRGRTPKRSNSQVNGIHQEVKRISKRPDLKALAKACFY
nr:unnamed protein product [Digitaria exilis]